MGLTQPTVRAKRPRQSAADRQSVYDFVTARDVTCRRPVIDPHWPGVYGLTPECFGPLERHHAGNKLGMARRTDALHVVLLCESCHMYWAPSHSRMILDWLAAL